MLKMGGVFGDSFFGLSPLLSLRMRGCKMFVS